MAIAANCHDLYARRVDTDERCCLGIRIEISVVIHAPDDHYPRVIRRKEGRVRSHILRYPFSQNAFRWDGINITGPSVPADITTTTSLAVK